MRYFRLTYYPFIALTAAGLIIMVLFAPLKIHDTETISIAPGADNIGHFVIDTHGGGGISGDYLSTSGRQVVFMMLDEEQYEDYLTEQSHTSLLNEIGASGDFSIDRPAMEWCHVVVEHSSEPENAEQVTLTYTVNSMNWNIVAVATALIFISAIATAIVSIKHSKDKKAALGPISSYDDVVMFDEEPRK